MNGGNTSNMNGQQTDPLSIIPPPSTTTGQGGMFAVEKLIAAQQNIKISNRAMNRLGVQETAELEKDPYYQSLNFKEKTAHLETLVSGTISSMDDFVATKPKATAESFYNTYDKHVKTKQDRTVFQSHYNRLYNRDIKAKKSKDKSEEKWNKYNAMLGDAQIKLTPITIMLDHDQKPLIAEAEQTWTGTNILPYSEELYKKERTSMFENREEFKKRKTEEDEQKLLDWRENNKDKYKTSEAFGGEWVKKNGKIVGLRYALGKRLPELKKTKKGWVEMPGTDAQLDSQQYAHLLTDMLETAIPRYQNDVFNMYRDFIYNHLDMNQYHLGGKENQYAIPMITPSGDTAYKMIAGTDQTKARRILYESYESELTKYLEEVNAAVKTYNSPDVEETIMDIQSWKVP